jgi:hypothetical protein
MFFHVTLPISDPSGYCLTITLAAPLPKGGVSPSVKNCDTVPPSRRIATERSENVLTDPTRDCGDFRARDDCQWIATG